MDDLRLTRVPVVRTGMLVRRAPGEVFEAFVDPAVTTRFWFSRSSGRMTPGARLRWEWETYGVSTGVLVREVEEGSRIVYEWNDDKALTVEIRFTACDGGTYVEVTESGLGGDGDEVVAHVGDSTGGFATVLCALKALLEHDIELAAVPDKHPKGIGGTELRFDRSARRAEQ